MSDQLDYYVAIWMPTEKDGQRTATALKQSHVSAIVCVNVQQVIAAVEDGIGAVLSTEELIASDYEGCLQTVLNKQPAWSSVPFVVIARSEMSKSGIRESLNAFLIERPVRIRTLLSAVHAALRSRKQQYQVREHLAARAASQARHAYLVKLNDLLRPLADPRAVQAAACRCLGEHLGASRVAYFENDGSEYLVEGDYHRNVASLSGRYPMSAFGDFLVESFKNNRTIVEEDATSVMDRTESQRAAFAAINVKGHIDVPLVKAGQWVGGITVHSAVARRWTEDEVAMVQETAERTWSAMEQARAERELRLSEDRFRTLFETMDEGYCVIEPIWDSHGNAVDYRYLLANRAIEEHTGLKDIEGKTAREIMPGHESMWIEAYGRTARTGEAFRRVDFVKDLKRWFDVSAFRVGENQVGVLFADVTSRRLAEDKLRTSEARLADVFRHAPSFMAVLSGKDMIIERVNEHYLELIGNREVIGLPVREALPEVEGQGFFELLDTVFETGEARQGTDQRVSLVRDGKLEVRIVDFVYQPMRDELGKITGILCQGIDITERVRAEGALRQQDERLQLAVGIAHMGTFEHDLETDAFTVNEPGREIYGWSESKTTFAKVQEAFHVDDRPRVVALFTDACSPGGPGIFEIEYRIARPDRETRWIKLRGKVFFEGIASASRAVLCVGAFLDITQQKSAEDELREADRKKDDFIALLAHELRNPLAPIRSGLQVLKIGGQHQNAALEMMDRQLTHMVRLVDDLLDISRIGRNKLELRRQIIDLETVIHTAIETAKPTIDAARHSLIVAPFRQPIYVDADVTRLAQVFANLLTNAAKYTPPQGTIWIDFEAMKASVLVHVRDNGIGIPRADRDSIFNMFSQVDRSVERLSGGLGIGLALVKALTEMHGGKVTVDSDMNGSTFTIELPTLEPKMLPVPSATSEDHAADAAMRILVVDDNRDSANTLSQLLRLLGNQVATAYDGVEAVDTAADFRPQLVLMDVGMPKLNGYEAARQIRQYDWGKDISIYVLSGWGQENDKKLSADAGCNGHLIKPVSMSELRAVLGKVRSPHFSAT